MKKPVKLIINRVDVLPYIFAILIGGGYILVFLASRGFIPLKNPEIGGMICYGFFLLALFNYFKRIHPPKGINFDSLTPTEDIKISNFRSKSSMNNGNTINYIKFYFSEDTAYMYMRNLIKIYEGPISIKALDNNEGNFHITKFTKINDYEIKLGIESVSGMTSFHFLMRYISEKDLTLLKENFAKMGYKLNDK